MPRRTSNAARPVAARGGGGDGRSPRSRSGPSRAGRDGLAGRAWGPLGLGSMPNTVASASESELGAVLLGDEVAIVGPGSPGWWPPKLHRWHEIVVYEAADGSAGTRTRSRSRTRRRGASRSTPASSSSTDRNYPHFEACSGSSESPAGPTMSFSVSDGRPLEYAGTPGASSPSATCVTPQLPRDAARLAPLQPWRRG